MTAGGWGRKGTDDKGAKETFQNGKNVTNLEMEVMTWLRRLSKSQNDTPKKGRISQAINYTPVNLMREKLEKHRVSGKGNLRGNPKSETM